MELNRFDSPTPFGNMIGFESIDIDDTFATMRNTPVLGLMDAPVPVPVPVPVTVPVLEHATIFKAKDMQEAMDEVVNRYSQGMTFRKIRREAGEAWRRKFPNTAPTGAFQAFIKDAMAGVRESHPNSSHQDRMKVIGRMWAESKPAKQMVGVKRNNAAIANA